MCNGRARTPRWRAPNCGYWRPGLPPVVDESASSQPTEEARSLVEDTRQGRRQALAGPWTGEGIPRETGPERPTPRGPHPRPPVVPGRTQAPLHEAAWGIVMSDDQVVRIVQTLIWATSLVVCILLILPVARFAIRRDLALREKDRRPEFPRSPDARRLPGAVHPLRPQRPRP